MRTHRPTPALPILWTLAAIVALLGLLYSPPARADQGSLCMPTTGTVSGLTFAQDVNAGFQALVTANSGATAPDNPCSGLPELGQFWVDNNTTPVYLKVYDGTAWETIGVIDDATGRWTPVLGGGASSIVAAATTDLWAAAQPEAFQTITGATTITSFGGSTGVVGTLKAIRFTGAPLITHNATSLILPGGANIQAAANDTALVVNLGGGNTMVVAYTKADGAAVAPTNTFSGQLAFTGVITATPLSGTLNNWNPAGLSSATIIRADPVSATTITGITAQPTGAIIDIQNVGTSASITLVNESASSTATNRFLTGNTSTGFIITPNNSVLLRYDGSRWYIISSSISYSTSAQGLAGTDDSTIMTPERVMEVVEEGYRLTSRRQFSANTTYTPTTGTRYILAILVGGGGGGVPSVNLGQAKAGGGGAGGTVTYYAGAPATVAVTIGAGGAGSTGNGSTGGTTILAGLAAASGGGGGTGASGAAGATTMGQGGITSSGSSSGTMLNIGAPGDSGIAATAGFYIAQGGNGGGGFGGQGAGRGGFASSGAASGIASTGGSAVTWGGGGGGAANSDGSVTATGGNGFQGVIIIYEYM